jgi:hypothetical protein
MKVQVPNAGEVLLPDFLVVGAAKSGTTSLHYYLKQHPALFLPERKEPWFFSFVGHPPEYVSPSDLPGVVHDVARYSELFADSRDGQQLGEASPSYLYTHETAIRNIRRLYGEKVAALRFIIILRNPVDRAWSQYWTFGRILKETLPFDEAVREEIIRRRLKGKWNIFYDYLGFGRYHDQVKAYLDAFGPERVIVFLFEDLRKSPRAVCERIFRFLGVDPSFRPRTEVAYNPSGKPKSMWLHRLLLAPSLLRKIAGRLLPYETKKRILHFLARVTLKKVNMAPETRRGLVAYYRDEVSRLEKLIGRDLSAWRR